MQRNLTVLFLLVLALPVAAPAQSTSNPTPHETTAADTLLAELTRQDSLLFDALFVQCDADRANTFFAEDVEFYDDRSGLSVGDEVRENSRRVAENCPAENGVRRILLEETLETHPIDGYGAVQMGTHHFVEREAATSTVGRFVHIWKRVDEEWKLARIISIHDTMDAARAAEQRGE